MKRSVLFSKYKLRIWRTFSRKTGKNRQDKITDAALAVETYKSGLGTLILVTSDRRMCKSTTKENRLDGRLISILGGQEKQAARDRQVAVRLSRGEQVDENSSVDAAQESTPTDVDEELLNRLESIYVSTDGYEDILDQAESSTWASFRIRATENINGTSIPINENGQFLFLAKEVEFPTPNRTYYHIPTCSRFIPKEYIKANVVTCKQCGQRTYTICKGAEYKV
ncbi:hypothetical protein LX36DRAFT_588219 [Colletotrichum falcatum]|nr:hypothetical protein LX36DRAFT_588219 [Colletotrichum falcatum]